jgi:subtilisin-like proprotein convertase family protein
MKSIVLVILSVLGLAAWSARASTVVEVLGRVAGANATSGPWAGTRVGEYLHMTFEVNNGVNVPGSSCGSNMQRFALVQGTLHATVHGVQMDAPLALGGGGYLNPSCLFANNCPVADVIMFESGANFASPGSSTTSYGMIFELHDSTGHAWNSSDLGQCLGFYGPSTFDYVEWNVGGLTLQFLRMAVHASGEGTGSCCLGDGGCSVTGQAICSAGGWMADGTCGSGACAPAGACCMGTGGCSLMTQAACEANPNAVYQGDGTACETSTCPPTSACCVGGTCMVMTEQACLNTGGTWSPPVNGWLGTPAGCSIQPQQHHSILQNLPDATGTTTVTPGVFTDTITLTDPTTVQSVEVWLGLGLPRINDFKFRLTGPNGVTLDLVTRIGATPPDCTTTPVGPGYSMYDTLILDDSESLTFYEHVTSAPAGSRVSGGRYRPAGCGNTPVSLNAASPAGFGGIPMAGNWTLEVRDERSGIQAYLNAWGLSFNGGSPPPCTVTCGSADFNCDGDSATDADIEAFFACVAGNCPPPPCNASADFNHDGDSGTDADIEAFFRVLAGGTC